MGPHRAAVITCSDRAAAEVYADRSGPVLQEALTELGFETAAVAVVPDDAGRITHEIRQAVISGARVVVTTGGTGVGPRDVTVEATLSLIDYQLPGLMEEVRRRGATITPYALISRGIVGIVALPGRPRAVVINAPGSPGGARDTIAVISPLLEHIVDQLDGGEHVLKDT